MPNDLDQTTPTLLSAETASEVEQAVGARDQRRRYDEGRRKDEGRGRRAARSPLEIVARVVPRPF